MDRMQWSEKALAALKDAGLVQTGMVNIIPVADGLAFAVADDDNDVHAVTIQ